MIMQRIDELTSRQIRIMRVFAIFFMMYVHVNPGALIISESESVFLRILKVIFTDFLGRASVPALTVVSGYLISIELDKKKYLLAIKKRMKSILIPMITWNILAVLLGVLLFVILGQETSFHNRLSDSFIGVFYSNLFAIDYGAIQPSHNFMRDLFVCSILSGPIYYLIKKCPLFVLSALFFVAITFGFSPIVYRSSIILFYSFGLYLGGRQNGTLLPHMLQNKLCMILGVVGIIVFGFYELIAEFNLFELNISIMDKVGYELTKQALVSYVFIYLTYALVSRGVNSLFMDAISILERRIFMVYLSHNIALTFLWAGWQIIFGSEVGFKYIAFYLASPLIWLFSSYYLNLIIQSCPEFIQIVLSGKKIRYNTVFKKTGQVQLVS